MGKEVNCFKIKTSISKLWLFWLFHFIFRKLFAHKNLIKCADCIVINEIRVQIQVLHGITKSQLFHRCRIGQKLDWRLKTIQCFFWKQLSSRSDSNSSWTQNARVIFKNKQNVKNFFSFLNSWGFSNDFVSYWVLKIFICLQWIILISYYS